MAIQANQSETALWLITSQEAKAAGLNCSAPSQFGEPPLFFALNLGMADVCKALVDAGADINNKYLEHFQNNEIMKKIMGAGNISNSGDTDENMNERLKQIESRVLKVYAKIYSGNPTLDTGYNGCDESEQAGAFYEGMITEFSADVEDEEAEILMEAEIQDLFHDNYLSLKEIANRIKEILDNFDRI